MSQFFRQLINDSRRITRDQFAGQFGGIPEDVAAMLSGEKARQSREKARSLMEEAGKIGDIPRLQNLEFGRFDDAPELAAGLVAAVDGTPVLPAQRYTVGQALCVGIGSVSHRREVMEDVHYWSSKAFVEGAPDEEGRFQRVAKGNFNINTTAFLRYYEAEHGKNIGEQIVLFDGALIYEWLFNTKVGVELYAEIFNSGKKCMGVIKNINSSPRLAFYGGALRQGELYIVETFGDHLMIRPDHHEARAWARGEQAEEIKRKVYRGVFKPRKKPFGFEVHADHLSDMIRIMAADCQINHVGHEIPYLLNRADEEVRRHFSPQILKMAVSKRLAKESEDLFFSESEERDFR